MKNNPYYDWQPPKAVEDKWEVSWSDIIEGGTLGNGAFGEVIQAKLTSKEAVADWLERSQSEEIYDEEEGYTVAVKKLLRKYFLFSKVDQLFTRPESLSTLFEGSKFMFCFTNMFISWIISLIN